MECVHEHSLDAFVLEQFEVRANSGLSPTRMMTFGTRLPSSPRRVSVPGGENDRVHRRLGSGLFGDA
jgi:hypothetical protein